MRHLLPTGKVMIWPGDDGIGQNQQPQSWNPADQTVSTLPRVAGYDIFCSGHSFLADGRLFVAGGHIDTGVGVRNASIYNPFGNPPDSPYWTALPLMNAGRWYPTVTVLANGDVLVVSGSIDGLSDINTVPQVFQVGSGTWRNLQELAMDLYPSMFLAPNGKVFNSGPSWDTRYLDTAGSGTWSFVGLSVRCIPRLRISGDVRPRENPRDGRWRRGLQRRPVGADEYCLGDRPQSALTDLARVGSMEFARRQLNATLLPDGNVLVTGGTSSCGFNDPAGAVHAAELWNPTTEQWTTLASSSGIPRIYHSSALLLPDARVLSMGGNVLGNPYPDTRISEIYSPPYLFKGTRPTITSAPTSVAYGQSFFVQTPDAAAITNGGKVTMLRLSSVTHAFNMSQYINEFQKGPSGPLSFSQVTGGLNVVAPSGAAVVAPTPTVAPPGPYMLFILNGSGVPSVAKIVQVGSGPAAPTLISIAVTPANPTIQTGATQQFTATGTYSDLSTQNITTQVTWASSPTGVATIPTGRGWPRACPLAALPYPRHCPG